MEKFRNATRDVWYDSNGRIGGMMKEHKVGIFGALSASSCHSSAIDSGFVEFKSRRYCCCRVPSMTSLSLFVFVCLFSFCIPFFLHKERKLRTTRCFGETARGRK